MSSKLNELQNATVGMTVGVIEVLILQPFNYAKNMAQQRQPIQLNPMIMYRGVGANAVNMGSCTMIQFAVGGKLKHIVTGGEAKTRHLTLAEEMICGIGAGAVSGLVGSPLELIMIQQQRKGGGTVDTIKNIIKNPPDVYRGLLGCAIREALWTCGYLSIPPVVRRTLMEKYPDTFTSNDKARVPAALLGGLFACYLTQWADTIKTCMQGDIERTTYGTFSASARHIWAESGIPGFYRGATFRYGRMACAVFIMDYSAEFFAKLMYPNAFA
ncbi:Solute carrier family 25 [Seminavis robusta]|uniref:Solute carrier family 25 n=1 Tax=Seminavis robusta TaxID=568900 RepID=A0A9N8E0Q4_9STRA|nr:Solute carrier family 25 [Seminavis robusta]|eukprot:Sro445_g144480.1 Solute carrier family 25 (271) ;mRNA; f:14719-15617